MLAQNYRKISVCLVLCFVILLSFGASPRFSFGSVISGGGGAETGGSGTGVIVPLYSYPGPSWQTLIQDKEAHPSVPVIAIINPASGPGSSQDPNFLSGIQTLEAAGITVLGYVWTDYGGIQISQAEQEISTYSQWYPVNGVFFDGMSNVPGFESYYSTLTSYALSFGMSMTVGNPGTSVPSSFIGTVTNIVIYENSGLPSTSYLSSLGYSPSDFSVMSYDVSSFDASFVSAAAPYVSYLYVTDANLPNPYDALPSYLSSLMAALATVNPILTASQTLPITVESVNMSGSTITGLWTVLQDGSGNNLSTGFTPVTFDPSSNSSYQVTVSNYEDYVFSHWADGSTNCTEEINGSSPTTLIAYYEVLTPITVTVDSFDLSGNEIPGLYTTVQLGGQVMASGFTPLSFQATPGSNYTVTVDNYENYNFDYWANGSASSSITIAPTSSMELQAYYLT